MTVEAMLSDWWAHHYYDNPNADQEEFENPDFEEDLKEMFPDVDMQTLLNNDEEWEELK